MKRFVLAIIVCFAALSVAQVTVTPIVQPHVFFVDAVGNPCVACKLYTYIAGTTTPQPTYIDSTGIPTNTNPIILDASGGAQIWLGNNSYKFVLKTSAGVTLWTVDNVSGGGFQFTVFEHNGVPLPNQKILNFLDATPGLPASGTADIFLNDSNGGLGSFTPNATSSSTGTVQPDNLTTFVNSGIISANAAGGLQMAVAPPGGVTQYVIVRPSGGSGSCVAGNTCNVGPSSASLTWYCSGVLCNTVAHTTASWVFSGSSLPAGVVAGNVTAVYAYSTNSAFSKVNATIAVNLRCNGSDVIPTGQPVWPQAQSTTGALAGITGSNFTGVTCAADLISGGAPGPAGISVNVPDIGLILAYTGTPITPSPTLYVQSPLNYSPVSSTLSLKIPFDAGNDTGAANAYLAALPGYDVPFAGEQIKFLATHASTSTTPTLNFNSTSAYTIVGPQGQPLVSGDITTTVAANVIFSNGKWYLQNPQASLTLAGGTGMTGNQGTGLLVQHSTGSTTTNDCVKFDANGNTIDSGAACQIGTGKTCNANGCYTIAGDGTITEWGYSTAASSGSAATLTITFPSAFNSTTHLVIVADGYGTPSGDGNPHPLACHIVDSTVTTSGASVIVALPTQVGGSGYSALNSTVKCSWHALGD